MIQNNPNNFLRQPWKSITCSSYLHQDFILLVSSWIYLLKFHEVNSASTSDFLPRAPHSLFFMDSCHSARPVSPLLTISLKQRFLHGATLLSFSLLLDKFVSQKRRMAKFWDLLSTSGQQTNPQLARKCHQLARSQMSTMGNACSWFLHLVSWNGPLAEEV